MQGSAWFGVQTPDGVAYTRDGRLHTDETGALLSVNNYPVLDAGGAAILLDPTGGAPTISQDGMISQEGRQMSAVGLFSIPNSARLARYDNSSVKPDQPAVAVLDFDNNGVAQGMSEGSNVNPVLELSRLIAVTRAFEGASTAIQSSENSMTDAIKSLGGAS